MKSGLTEADYDDLKAYIVQYVDRHPANAHGHRFPGDIVRNTNGAYKIRYTTSLSHVGKSGSHRVIYCVVRNNFLAFLDVYKKTRKESIPEREKKMFARVIRRLQEKEWE